MMPKKKKQPTPFADMMMKQKEMDAMHKKMKGKGKKKAY